MKNRTTLAVLIAVIAIFSIQSVFAGPFGIEKGMSLAEIKRVCNMTPEPIGDNKYYIVPPQTNELFEKYIVQIDPEYGVYWLKAIGKDIYTNGHGEMLISTFWSLVGSIRRTYGEESYIKDVVKEDSIFDDSGDFMYALQKGDRELYVAWSRMYDLTIELLSDPEYMRLVKAEDTIGSQNYLEQKILEYTKLPSDISDIGVFANALSNSMGYLSLEYSFSNYDTVKAKSDSVF
jgi:hypothetical protein